MSEKINKKDLANLPFMDSSLDLEERVDDLLSRLIIEEKFRLLSGRRIFHMKPIKRLGIKSFKMTDGPNGVGAIGTFLMKKTTFFPAAICRTATWNVELSKKYGKAVAEEVRDVGYHMNLAPGININRTPLGGRTFEYQTEDPYLNARTVVAVVKGLQGQRIAACVKHYACNNQELNRFKMNAEIGERALQEIYLPAYEASVREADAWSMMACYNKFNGTHGCENENLLRERLMDGMGFRGFVVSDWFATRFTHTDKCMNAGLSLEMPWAIVYKMKKLKKEFAAKKFTEEILNDNVKRLLRVMFLTGLFDDKSKIPPGSRNTREHQDLARTIAEEGIVLLKNENNILPLDIKKIKTIAVLGPLANKKFAFGGGSSMVRAKYEISALKGLKKKLAGKVQIIKEPSEADVAILFVGLTHKKHEDRENMDKLKLELSNDQVALINETLKLNSNTIIVLINGSPITMEGWGDKASAIVEAWFGGLEAGNAIANVLFGDVNPSGKLPITFPKILSDSPAHASKRTYSAGPTVYYDEGIFVGYRHFDAKDIKPLFPFGHGLSYTTFKFDNFQLSKEQVSESDKLTVSLDLTNSGKKHRAEVVQLYVQDVDSSVERPPKELKGFKKVFLEPGEKKAVKFELDKKDLSFFDEKSNSWVAEKGEFKLLIGSSSRDIRLEGKFNYIG